MLLALGALVAQVDERIRPKKNARGALLAFIDAHLAGGEGASPEAVACWVAIGPEALFQPEVRALYLRIVTDRRDRLVALLREEVCRIEKRSTRGLEAIAASVLASIEGYFQIAMGV